RLQGGVHGLILKDWEPTTFDARFFTPDDDDSRHRISQRAVENLASLGGAGAVLSSTFLRIFEEFSYRRLGISCRLNNGVCEMDGVAPAEGGYYIVEGGGLPPRIDVRGFNRRVDWEMLLSRLQLIVTSDGPVIR
ncbi:MAG: C4-dicarboxylate ABC transporter, partial [Proteobacteria bacterium]|nr:C4-dicarboxylate ABC transporter [Pseudomonadota bacterium]